MELIWQGIKEAIGLILAGDPAVLPITALSVRISGGARGPQAARPG